MHAHQRVAFNAHSHPACKLCGLQHKLIAEPLCPAEIETELRKLEREETKLIGDVKKAAKENNTATAKVLAKNLVRLRKNKARMQESVAQLTGVNAGMKTQQVWCSMHGAVDAQKFKPDACMR